MRRRVNLSEDNLNRIIKESVKKVLNEGQYDDNPIKKWVYWCFNYHNPEKWMSIFQGAPKEHFMDKFLNSRDMNRFFVELDSTNQQILIDYVMNNY